MEINKDSNPGACAAMKGFLPADKHQCKTQWERQGWSKKCVSRAHQKGVPALESSAKQLDTGQPGKKNATRYAEARVYSETRSSEGREEPLTAKPGKNTT